MSKRAWFYILGTILAASLLSAVVLIQRGTTRQDWVVFVVLAALGTLTQQFKAHFYKKAAHSSRGSTSYSPLLVFLFAGVVLLPPPLYILLVLFPHLVEWVVERSQKTLNLTAWYIQPFNIATHLLAGLGAQVVYALLGNVALLPFVPAAAAAGFAAALVYAGVNHLLIGGALVLTRGVSWQESGVGDFENVTSDLIMLYLGFGFALLWRTNPWFTPTLLLPLVLIQRALKVPQLRIEATYDDKTGLLNHRHFTRSLEIELDRARRFQHPFVVIMADLDLLRNINNTYGHLAGDIVLAGIANVIRKNLREYDIAGRFGGEEFSLVLPETGLEVALAAAERLRRSVAAASFSVATSPVPIQATMSFGLAVFPADGRTSSELLHAADLAVYQAKLRGRNRTVAASEVPRSASLASAAPAVLRNAPAEAQAAPTAVTGTAGQNVGSTAFRCAPPRPAPPSF